MMKRRLLLAGIVFTSAMWADGAVYQYPYYTAASIVNAASYSSALAPNTIMTIFGTNLAAFSESAASNGLRNAGLPLSLGGTFVYLGGIQVGLYYASPTQVNLLVPSIMGYATFTFVLCKESACGPEIPITLTPTAPAFFQDAQNNIIAQHLDGSVISAASPAKPGEWVVLYCDGLGRTIPDNDSYTPPGSAAPIQLIKSFSVLVDGQPVDPSAIYYAGVTPGYAGLYQVNLLLPATAGTNPEIRMSFGDSQSIPGTHLFVQHS